MQDWRTFNEQMKADQERIAKLVSETKLAIRRRLEEAEHKEQEDEQ